MRWLAIVLAVASLPACAEEEAPFVSGGGVCLGCKTEPVDGCLTVEQGVKECEADFARFQDVFAGVLDVFFYDPGCICSQTEVQLCQAKRLGDQHLIAVAEGAANGCWDSIQ